MCIRDRYYTLFTVDDDKNITDTETLPSPQGCGCKSNIASVLKEKGVTVMLAGSMGDGALKVLSDQGIKVFRGCKGDVRKIAEGYLKGFILDSGICLLYTSYRRIVIIVAKRKRMR